MPIVRKQSEKREISNYLDVVEVEAPSAKTPPLSADTVLAEVAAAGDDELTDTAAVSLKSL